MAEMTFIRFLGGIALCGVGVAGLVGAWRDFRRWRAVARWPVADGLVVGSEVDQRDGCQDDYAESLKLTYVFTVNGRTFTGSRVRAGQDLHLTIGHVPGTAWSGARTDAEAYPPGRRVDVRYEPRDPSNCCLQSGGMPGILFKSALCVGLAVVGIGLVRGSLW